MLRKLWIEVRSSLWFIPGLLVLGSILLAVVLIKIDLEFGRNVEHSRWRPFFDASAEGARGVLAAIAGSMITVAGVAFSITIVTLSLASTQYTPRILRTFMRDRSNQTVLGVFVGVFTYCLVVMRTIRGAHEDYTAFVPLTAVFAAVVLALVAVAFLIFFIHHTAASIQASYLLRAITKETLATVESLFPEAMGEAEDPALAEKKVPHCDWHPLASHAFGYVQNMDTKALIAIAVEHDMVVRLDCSIGDFVMEEAPLASTSKPLKEDAAKSMRSLFVIGDFRTVDQDAGFGVRQIVDIAIKALSPGVNDTSTAISCLDHLGVILGRLAPRCIPSPYREVEDHLRAIAPAPTFAEHVAKSFDEIRLSAPGNVSIMVKMLNVIQTVGQLTANPPRRETLLVHARLIRDLAAETVRHPYDRARITREMATLRQALKLEVADLPPLPAKTERPESLNETLN